jgi:toxin ParE1/3/4
VPGIIVRASARREIKKHGLYLEEHGGPAVSDRFFAALATTFDELTRMPQMAPLCGFGRPALKRVRRWPVKGFENWLIFYQPKRDGIEVVHVIHGARDIESLFDG